MSLPRVLHGIRIVPLSPDLCDALSSDAFHSINGDGSCSLSNMESSCFASEYCSKGLKPQSQLRSMLASKCAFVAISDISPDGFRETDTAYRFVGCISADDGPHPFFPQLSSGSLVISNLCVASPYRRFGVGKRLIQTILDGYEPEKCYLLVAKNMQTENADMHTVFEKRVRRLLNTYNRLSFVPVCERSGAFLLQYRP